MRVEQLIYLCFLASILVTVDTKCNCNSTSKKFPDSTAFLFLDYEVGAVAFLPNTSATNSFLDQSLSWLRAVRASKHGPTQIMFSRVEFRPGYPEISCQNKEFAVISQFNILIEGTPSAQFYHTMQPNSNEIQFDKRRVSAAYNSDLLTLLDSQCIRTVVLTGLFTSGVVLATTRQLADMDFTIYIIQDAVIDPNSTVNEVLLDSVLSSQATILTVAEAKKML
jgi:nicotinamidase-related amidase